MEQSGAKKPRRKVDPVGTRKAIVEAAIARFSLRGYSGTTMEEIASAAGVTKSLVQYHYETKEQLWQAALVTCMGPFLDAVDEFISSHGSRSDRISLVRHRFEAFAARPETIRMLGWATLDQTPLPDVAMNRARRIWSGQLEGRPEPERMRMLVAFAAIDGWMLMRRLYGTLLGRDLTTHEVNEFLLETIERDLLELEKSDETES